MPNPTIQTSIHGRRFGLGPDNEVIVDGTRKGFGGNAYLPMEGLARVACTTAQMTGLSVTAKTIVAAPGAGFIILPKRFLIQKQAGTAYGGIAPGEDLVFTYTNVSGEQVSSVIETTGFLDQASIQLRAAFPPGSTGTTVGSYTPLEDAAVCLTMLSGAVTNAGVGLVLVWCWYDVLPSPLTL